MFSWLTDRTPPALRNPVVMPWLWAAAMVVGAFLIRLSLQPVLGGALPYSIFYPAVILAAYALGRGPAVAAAIAASLLAFFCFVEPGYAWKTTPQALTSLAFFNLVCAVAIVVITGLTGALKDVSRQLGRAQAVADSHAGLFRELNERMSHQMRLVAGVLALQAKGEPEPQVADSLRRAMERTLLISRVHRELGGRSEEAVDFDAFAAALARAVCVARGQPPERVLVDASGLKLGVEEATSLGVALAECLGTLFDTGVASPLRIRFDTRGRRVEVAISEAGEDDGALVSVTNGYLLRAMTEQLGAEVALRADAEGSALVLSMPRAGSASVTGSASTLH
jgi:hypothetical protein